MPRCTIDDIPGEFGVVELIWIGVVVEGRSKPFEEVYMSEQHQIDVVLVKGFFEGFLTIFAYRTTYVPRAMSSYK